MEKAALSGIRKSNIANQNMDLAKPDPYLLVSRKFYTKRIVKFTQKRKKTLPRIFPLCKSFKQNKLK
jgi:hypothetical protein